MGNQYFSATKQLLFSLATGIPIPVEFQFKEILGVVVGVKADCLTGDLGLEILGESTHAVFFKYLYSFNAYKGVNNENFWSHHIVI